MTDRLEGKVVRLITDDELLINLGSEVGVDRGDIFRVLDPRTMNVGDLGSIERVKARVEVTKTNRSMALARVINRATGISAIAKVMSGETRTSRLTSDVWPDGVEAGDPVVWTPPLLPETKP